ncbi:hypothetical protein [Psychroserpens sp.]|uniref:hypothetical protein n=1 Tax=Psychroserpens sp. TaxID=2020870 RepID=UPI002B27A10E|nr:hypothetical protein [Psychroserpens sp.]
MNDKDAFAIHQIEFNQLNKDDIENSSKFVLQNYCCYEPKLDVNFYLKYFIYKLLFDTRIIELTDFLEYHYDYCENPEKYYSILDLEIIPKILEIIENAEPNFQGRGYYNEEVLEGGFIESEGVIYNWDLDYPKMYHLAGLKKLQNQFKKRIQIVQGFVDEYEEKAMTKPLKWISGPSQLAIVIRELINKGYMEADKTRGEINNSRLSRELFKAFSIEDCDSPKSIEIYLSSGNKRYQKAKEVFDKRGFSIPDADYT